MHFSIFDLYQSDAGQTQSPQHVAMSYSKAKGSRADTPDSMHWDEVDDSARLVPVAAEARSKGKRQLTEVMPSQAELAEMTLDVEPRLENRQARQVKSRAGAHSYAENKKYWDWMKSRKSQVFSQEGKALCPDMLSVPSPTQSCSNLLVSRVVRKTFPLTNLALRMPRNSSISYSPYAPANEGKTAHLNATMDTHCLSGSKSKLGLKTPSEVVASPALSRSMVLSKSQQMTKKPGPESGKVPQPGRVRRLLNRGLLILNNSQPHLALPGIRPKKKTL